MKKAKYIIEFLKNSKIAKLLLPLFAVCVVLSIVLLFVKHSDSIVNSPSYSEQIIVSDGQSLYTILKERGFTDADISVISGILKSDAEFSTLRANEDKILFTGQDKDSPIDKITLIPNPWKHIEVQNNEGQWQCNVLETTPDIRLIYKQGKIEDGDSFYGAGLRSGIPQGVLANVYDLLAFEMDFERDIRAGQNFSVLYEENFANGEKIENGRIIAISFEALRGDVKMYRFKKSDDNVGYYDEKGNGAIKSLKRTPINNASITSKFNPNRKHPVLGYTRAHKGVDFRAGTGTPIPSAGAGRVVAKKYDKGYGYYVKIRHNNSYETLYAHMSRFAKNIKVGSSVRQGQIIGYVGSTGYSTGPHLHYEIIKNGRHVNPMTVKLPSISNLGKTDKSEFLDMREILDTAVNVMESKPDMFIQM